MPLFYNDIYQVKLPDMHRFPMEKYGFVRRGLQLELGHGLATFHPSPLVEVSDLLTVHDEDYVHRFLENRLSTMENRKIGFPWSDDSVKRALSSTGGTVEAMHAVCAPGSLPRFSGHLAGGTHHAYAGHGEGFCVFNDIAVAAQVALRDYSHISRVFIVDLDVHQGNGCASIFAAERQVFTFSMHCKANIFSRREESDLDVEVNHGASDEEYLEALQSALAPALAAFRPQLIFYQAGVDPHRSDRFGKLQLSTAGLKRRNRSRKQTHV